MKNLKVVLVVICACLPLLVSGAVISETTNGVYLVISGWPTNDPVQFDTPLVFAPFCDTGKVELIYPTDPAYGVKIKLTDPSGKDVPKTPIGKRFGSKFDQLNSYRLGRPFNFSAWGPYTNDLGMGGARPFCNYPVSRESWLRPKDLFYMERPGLYSLEIQMQMFYPNSASTNAWHQDLFRFSPVYIHVFKPEKK